MSSVMQNAVKLTGPKFEVSLAPVGYKILVEPRQKKQTTPGGIHLPEERVDAEQMACLIGEVVAMGSDCYQGEKFKTGPWCKVGDWVIFRSYAGLRIRMHGEEFRLLNDDMVEAVTDNPDEIERA